MKAVAFDLDGTLYDELEFVRGGFAAVADYLARRHGQEPGMALRRMDDLLAERGRGAIFDALLDELGLDRVQSAATLVYVYRTHEPRISLFPDVIPLFETLRANGLALAVLSDGMASVQRRKLDALGVERLVDRTVIASELPNGMGKPSSGSYRVLLDLLALRGEEVAYVGNDPVRDFAGALEVGMPTFRVRRPPIGGPSGAGLQVDAQRYIDPFSQLSAALLGA